MTEQVSFVFELRRKKHMSEHAFSRSRSGRVENSVYPTKPVPAHYDFYTPVCGNPHWSPSPKSRQHSLFRNGLRRARVCVFTHKHANYNIWLLFRTVLRNSLLETILTSSCMRKLSKLLLFFSKCSVFLLTWPRNSRIYEHVPIYAH